ncbi:hypothetical protein CWE09_04515 [Aliidiomarina minuta]|uniref:Uncharacterized protein n=1 Tax=Aliidiomarina minuta TaxID=880057 RepID=A0A432W7D6_9GAMM|nr:hypothetical protein [Aliidiomarina minuta]RUO25994.1 hypothetical protein CWE09_04515 [Aliidiomarina minuta]
MNNFDFGAISAISTLGLFLLAGATANSWIKEKRMEAEYKSVRSLIEAANLVGSLLSELNKIEQLIEANDKASRRDILRKTDDLLRLQLTLKRSEAEITALGYSYGSSKEVKDGIEHLHGVIFQLSGLTSMTILGQKGEEPGGDFTIAGLQTASIKGLRDSARKLQENFYTTDVQSRLSSTHRSWFTRGKKNHSLVQTQ